MSLNSAKAGKDCGFRALAGVLRRLVGLEPALARQVAALPWRRGREGGIEIMLVTTRESGRWVLPKGWPERGESLPEAAAREAFEEAGLSGNAASGAVGRYTYSKTRRDGPPRLCEVLVFPLQVRDVAESWPERKQRRRAWLAQAEAVSRVEQPELAGILLHFRPQETPA